LPDLYGYDYGSRTIHPETAEANYPVFACSASGETPLPTAMPHIVWRAGLDLNPLDATDPLQASWLETLVWPEQARRLANLQAALRIAAAHKPRIVKGDLIGDMLAVLCEEAPKGASLVVFHTAVLAYVTNQADRHAFADKVTSLCPYWLCNEAPRIFPDVASRAGALRATGRFLLSLNGPPLAWTDPHGAAIEWISHQRCESIPRVAVRYRHHPHRALTTDGPDPALHGGHLGGSPGRARGQPLDVRRGNSKSPASLARDVALNVQW
jgi:hypothetical protein